MSTCKIVGGGALMGRGAGLSPDRHFRQCAAGRGGNPLHPLSFAPPMRFEKVRLESFAHQLPEQRLRSAELEQRLAPLYERLKLNAGRLELMSGIRERRAYPRGTRPSAIAAGAGELALARAKFPRERVGALVHAGVCRDFLEPATASVVHERLRLSPACTVFDLSNACLGFANALCLVAARTFPLFLEEL